MRRIPLLVAIFVSLVAARVRPTRPPVPQPEVAGPTFSKEVVRIFQAHCQSCHHEGDIAPFSLTSYVDAKANAGQIRIMTATHQMPPWKPAASCGAFAEARTMPQDEIDVIGKWVANGAPQGNPADLPPPLDFSSGWALGTPDLELKSSEPFQPPAGKDTYRCFTLPANTTSDQYVSAIDVHPGDRATVHHVIAFIDTLGESQKLDDADPGPGYQCFGGPGFPITSLESATLGGWAPGARPVRLPETIALSLPANARVVLQVHYHPHHGDPQPDQTAIGIYYAKKPPKQLLRILPLINQSFTIPPNDPNYKVTASFTSPLPAHVWVIAPHMHLLGRKMHVEAALPTGETECLIDINDWDFNWQGMYRYDEGVPIPPLTRVSLAAYFDNSAENPRNPNAPPRSVSWGESTTDEMCIAFLGVTLDFENLALARATIREFQ